MCTSIMAGKAATADGTVLIARNEEFGVNNWCKHVRYRSVPCYEIGKGDWTLENGLTVAAPDRFYRYSAVSDAVKDEKEEAGDHFYFEERGINEKNVAISATNSMDMNKDAKLADPPAETGIDESILLSLLLPQAETAAGTVRLLGGYLLKYGASEANGILIADENEAWYFEIGSCHHWIAVRVPEQAYLVVANCMRVHSVDLDAPDVMHSEGLFTFVKEHGLLKEPDEHQFNFAKAFGTSGSIINGRYDPYYNVDRLWLAQNMLTPSAVQKPGLEEYPLFLIPDRKISVSDVMKVFRANYEGTELAGLATRNIGVVRTAESHIMTLNPAMPDCLKGVIWQALSSPLGSPYMPVFAAADRIPDCYTKGACEYTPDSAYWSFRGLFALADMCGISIYEDLWKQYEEKFIAEHDRIRADLSKKHEEGALEAAEMAKEYSEGILNGMVKAANKRFAELLTDIAVKQKDK